MSLRDYQQKALDKLLWARELPGNDLVVLPQGSGKSHVIAAYVEAIQGHSLILQPNREILQQNYNKLTKIVPFSKVGIYSASLDSKKVGQEYTFATIQSIYKKPELFKHIDTIIIDECDLVNPRKLGMYKQLWIKIGRPKIVGFTATPYRLSTKYTRYGELPWQVTATTVTEMINRVYPAFWNRLVFCMSTQELVEQGYLCELHYYDETLFEHEDIPLNKSKSEFDLGKHWKMIEDGDKEDRIINMISMCEDQHDSILVFCGSIDEAEKLASYFENAAVVTHKTKKKDRKNIIDLFKNGDIQIVFNVQALTVGFDHPELDCIILTRPTRSLRLYQQILGRGSRTAPGKKYCRVIDFSGSFNAIGPIEGIRVDKNDGKWDVYSDHGGWYHQQPLYNYKLKKPKNDEE